MAFCVYSANTVFGSYSYCVRTTFGCGESRYDYCPKVYQIIPGQGLFGICSGTVQYLYRIRIRYEAGTNLSSLFDQKIAKGCLTGLAKKAKPVYN